MATILQRQLAEIAANSTHQLDLKAQKAQHARSLLFDPADASRQSFDTIYQICREGFDELCQLDARFLSFSRNLFADDSKSVDRGQLTQEENTNLNRVVESFLGLVHGRLLLKPAQKSLEWLVRRWRIHEFTPVALLLTVLPYHKNDSIFPAVLALLSDSRELPQSLKWLHPYVASRSCPADHAVLAAATSSSSFFSAFNSHTMRIAKAGHASGILLAFWASLNLRVVNGLLDSSLSGRASVREQREQDILLMILPTLRDAFKISQRHALDEMYIGACMIVMLLATKGELADAAVDALMETVCIAWSETTVAGGLSCLIALAEAKEDLTIPVSCTTRMLRDNAIPVLIQLSHSQRVSKLTAAFALTVLRDQAVDITERLDVVREIFTNDILQEQHVGQVVNTLLTDAQSDRNALLNQPMQDILSVLSHNERFKLYLQQEASSGAQNSLVARAIEDSKTGVVHNGMRQTDDEMEIADVPTEKAGSQIERSESVAGLLAALPSLPHEHYSFLGTSLDDELFEHYSSVFCVAAVSDDDLQLFANRLIGKPDLKVSVTLFSFLARLWTSAASRYSAHSKMTAVECMTSALEAALARREKLGDLQAFYPYLLVALSDSNRSIRAAAAKLARTMEKVLSASNSTKQSEVWGSSTIYSKGFQLIFWMSVSDSHCLMRDMLIPTLDDSLLNAGFVKQYLAEHLSTKSSTKKSVSKDHYKAISNFLASQAATTPSLRTRLLLLQILASIHKGAESARTRYLLPLLRECSSQSEESLGNLCDNDGVRLQDVERTLLENVWQCSVDALPEVRETCLTSKRPGFVALAFDQQRRSWINMKSTQAKVDTLQWLLDLALSQTTNEENTADLALQTLRALELSSEVLLKLLETLPKPMDLQNEPPPAKKLRRVSNSEQSRPVAREGVQTMIRRITFVLELLEQARVRVPALLQPLFELLAELRQLKAMAQSDLIYLHTMTLDTLLSVIKTTQQHGTAERNADWNFVRIDLLIDCIRTSSSPHVQNTAVLLVSALASWIPDNVLHSVMPLFTFMSTTILQRNDEYSAHITKQAIAQIVPALAASLRTRGQSVLVGVSELLLSFVAAWEHVPLHRRLLTFELVIEALGSDSCLGAVGAMLSERYSEGAIPVADFIVDIVAHRSAVEIVVAANQWLELVSNESYTAKSKLGRQANARDVLFGFSEKDEDELSETNGRLIGGLRDLLRNSEIKTSLSRALTRANPDELRPVYVAYASLLERAIRLTQDLSDVSLPPSQTPSQLLAAILDLLPTTDFVASSAEIMQAGSDTSREMVFQSLESRVQACRPNDKAESSTFINLLPSCAIFVRSNQADSVTAAAIACVDAICEKFGKTSPIAVRDTAKIVASEAALRSENTLLRTLSLLCLASIASVLQDGDESLVIFPSTIDFTLDLLEGNAQRASKSEQDAGFRFLTSMLDNSAWMLASDPSKLDRALTCGVKSNTGDSEPVHDFLALAAKKTPLAELLASVERVWNIGLQDLESKRPSRDPQILRSFSSLVDILQNAIAINTKATVTKNAPAFFRLLSNGFDLPRRLGAADASSTLELSELTKMVDRMGFEAILKMNDATFRPFFIQLVDWATSSSNGMGAAAQKARTISLYRFALLLFERLGALVISYMGFLLESACTVLRTPSGTPTDAELVHTTVKVLDGSFRADEDDFWTAPAHFDPIEQALLDRIALVNRHSGSEGEVLVEAVSNFAAAVSTSPEHLKRMNTHLLSILRHEQADVRLLALQCQRAITAKVTFDWLALLPEMLPVISELQEDDDERVERGTLRWVKEIEDISGESLEGMLA